MIRALSIDARAWFVTWQRRRSVRRAMRDKGTLAFQAMLGVPFVALVFIIYVASTAQAPSLPLTRNDAARQRTIDLNCLAENIYYEARGEPVDGQYAVADVTLNRVRSPLFPHTVCEVVHEARWDPERRRFVAHFSWTELERLPTPGGPAWKQAMSIAMAAYDHAYSTEVPDALFYHATSVHPYWADTKKPVATIGNHIFYR
jgi:spore germination cell wall hydrolase CwlJ-like protein